MNNFLRKNGILLIAFALPIVLILGVAITTYIPSLMLSTKYNFIYTTCTDGSNYPYYDCSRYLKQRYSVADEKIVVHAIDISVDTDKNNVPDFPVQDAGRIFYHDTQKDESREITLKEAQALTLSGLLTSPDGVSVSGGYSRGGGEFFPFGGGSSSFGYYLTKGSSKRKINLINNDNNYYYQNNFQFLGWVLPGRL